MHFEFRSEKGNVFLRITGTIASFCFFQLIAIFSFAQSLPVGTPLLEDAAKRLQVKGELGVNSSFLVRPLSSQALFADDSTFQEGGFFISSQSLLKKGRVLLKSLPVSVKQQYNTNHPFGWNDGSMIPVKGYQSQLTAGLYAKAGPLSIQLQPEFVYAQNAAFSLFPASNSDSIWKAYYHILNGIDNPEKFGNGSYLKLFPGQSSVRLNYKKISIGVSTENLWWGPGVRNSLIMSNNAPGFKHITFNTTSPVKTGVGSFEWQVISGLMSSSGILPSDTTRTFEGQKLYKAKNDQERYLNGMVITWQPKWTKGLYLGITRIFYQSKLNVSSSLNGYLPIVTSFFKSKALDENTFGGRDQLFSFFSRLVLPESKAEVYAEYGRNDHSQNFRDLILEPEHARGYLVGVKKLFFSNKGDDIELFFELTNLQRTSTLQLREQPIWYVHHQIPHGYTNQGQVIGAGIGPGGSSQTIGLNWLKDLSKFGVMFERIVHNNDFYYDAFASRQEFGRHWVDLAFNLNKSWVQKRFIYSANLSLVRSLNYQWQYNTELDENVDVTNLHATFSISYLFR